MSVTDAAILLTAITAVAALHVVVQPSMNGAARAEIWVAGQQARQLSMDGARELDIEGRLGTTRIRLRDGGVRVIASPGPRKLCVRTGWLSRPGESAVCLPNRVVVTVTGSRRTLDAINQ